MVTRRRQSVTPCLRASGSLKNVQKMSDESLDHDAADDDDDEDDDDDKWLKQKKPT